MRIYRYQLDINLLHRRDAGSNPVAQQLDLPLGSTLLSVAPSRTGPNDFIDLWVQVPEEAPLVPYPVYVIGTGERFPVTLAGLSRFIGTVVTPGRLVWHVFQGDPQP